MINYKKRTQAPAETIVSSPLKAIAILIVTAIILVSQSALVSAASSSYYVSLDGNNSNPGTLSQPWKSLSYAGQKLRAGDTLYIRGGTYQETFNITSIGNQSNPIKITNYNDEEVIIDGASNTIPSKGSGGSLLAVWGEWVAVSNLTVRYSGGLGVYGAAGHVTFTNLYVHHNWGGGVILSGNYDLIQNSRIWYNSTMNENNQSTIGWGTGVSCARYPDYCTIRTTTAWENWGEGISTFEALHTTIEDNISYNNQQNIYISDTKYTVTQRNISYCTPGNAIDSYETQNGILVGDEKGVPIPLGPNGTRYASSENTFVNNLVIGCNRNLAAGSSEYNTYAYNTFVNAGGVTSEPFNVLFYAGTATNTAFMNNILVQEDNRPNAYFGATGIYFANNLWSKGRPSNAASAGDVIGDPYLSKASTLAPGQLTADYFKILSQSPAINRAAAISSVLIDFFKNTRESSPDIGANEFVSSQPTSVPTATSTPTAVPTSTPTTAPTSVPTATATPSPSPSPTPTSTPEPNPAPAGDYLLFLPFFSTLR
jgi:hypothetical protein